MRFFRRRSNGPQRDGCGFVLLTFLFSCFFLILNSALISKLVPPPEAAPWLLARPGVNQAVLFVGPVILIFLEWWLADFVVGLLTPQRDANRLPQERETAARR
ncbi:MAG TPA: hypothetical protein PLF81_16830 [Candidatus Anammoximicrobium sp.]|nr:hypothetical protein [Candidatus Anammoximicrobium sp.]